MPNDRLPTPERVLVVAAHPDDIEFGAAGTVARWVGEGAEVRYLVMTRGDKGSDDPSTDPRELAETREREQRAAAAEIGVAGVDFLDEPDGQMEPSLRLRERVTYAIRAFRPEVVMTHDPTVFRRHARRASGATSARPVTRVRPAANASGTAARSRRRSDRTKSQVARARKSPSE